MPTSDGEYRPIRRCVCGETSFEELKRRGVTSMEEAAEHGCGITCGRCRPYIQRMLETGETAFPVEI